MDIKQLRNFVAVADHQNFTKAAKFLNLSQPALSVSIRNLEQELDAELFLRTPKKTMITEAGSDFLIHARAALREIEKAEEIVAASKSERSQTVRIGLSSFFANMLAREVIGAFCHEFPRIRIEAEVMTQPIDNTIERITSGKWDFGLVLGHVAGIPAHQGKGIEIEGCSGLTTVVHARKEHPLANRDTVSLADLAEFPWVISTMTSGQGIADFFTEGGMKAPRILARANTLDFIVTMVETQDLLTILPVEIVNRYHKDSLVALRNTDIQFRPAPLILRSSEFVMTEPAKRLKTRIQTLLNSFGEQRSDAPIRQEIA